MVGAIFSASSVKEILMLMAIQMMKMKMVNRISVMKVKAHFSNAVCMKKAGKRLAGLLSKDYCHSIFTPNMNYLTPKI